MKYDWIVHPGADPSVIVQEYGGIEGLDVLPKKVKIRTAIGTLEEEMPYAYQGSKEVRARYQRGKDEVRINLGAYDRVKRLLSTLSTSSALIQALRRTILGTLPPLTIMEMLWRRDCLWYGVSSGFRSYDISYNGGFFDGAISKFSADGSQLLWSAYLGGNNLDQPHSMDCDENETST